MKNKRFFHSFTVLLAALVCLGGFSVTAYAGGGEDIPTDDSNVIVKTEPQPLTPEGNMELIDDIQGDASEDKQFIVVQSRGGNYFYIVIDKAAQGENTVHFLNQVDEKDLLQLMEDEQTEAPACSCTEKCVAGSVNTDCPVCSVNMSECAGKEVTEPTPQPAEPAETAPEKSTGGAGLVVVVLLLLLGGGGALYWFKLRKPKADTRGADDLDDYDYGEDEEDEDYEFEDENTADSEEDKNQ